MSWMTSLHRGTRIDTWTARKAARQAHGWVDETARWMRTDQAALMRYIPEQDRAFSWWNRQPENTANNADIVDIMPQWIEAFHNVTIDREAVVDDPVAMSRTAQVVQQLCRTRADQMASGATACCSPAVLAVLATLSVADVYRGADDLIVEGLPAQGGTLVFPQPLHVREDRFDAVAAAKAGDMSGQTEPQQIRAVTWLNEVGANGNPSVRCMDWFDFSGDNAQTGNDTLDTNVRQALEDQKIQLPPMMFGGEWVTRCQAPDDDAVTAARQRILTASTAVAGTRWKPGAILSNTTRPLALRLLAVLADAHTAGMVLPEPVAVATPGAKRDRRLPKTTDVTVFQQPGT